MRLTTLIASVGCLISSHIVYVHECSGYSDILIMMDDSDSTKRNNPNNPDTVIYAPGVINFLANFISNADFTTVRIGLQAFSKTARVVSEFTSDTAGLNAAISGFIPEYRGSDLSVSLASVRTTFATSGRLGTRHFAIILIDGSSDNAAAAASEAVLIEAAGIDVVVIAFGTHVADSELVSFSKNANDVFKVSDDGQLLSLQTAVSNKACSDPCTPYYTSPMGFFENPGNCARFIQTAPLTPTTNRCFFMPCGWNTMWNDNYKACTFPSSSSCDPCRGHPDGRVSTYDIRCNSYWECQGGVSVARCCGSGKTYVQGQGCVTGTCTDTCP